MFIFIFLFDNYTYLIEIITYREDESHCLNEEIFAPLSVHCSVKAIPLACDCDDDDDDPSGSDDMICCAPANGPLLFRDIGELGDGDLFCTA